MAIAVMAKATPATALCGTTLTAPTASGTISVTAGDLVVCCCFDNPSSNNITFSKSTGTATIGTFTNFTKLTNGSVCGLTMGYANVTGTGTLAITATSSGTITSAI